MHGGGAPPAAQCDRRTVPWQWAFLRMAVGPRGKNQHRRADRSCGGLARVLAAIAVLLQIAIPGLYLPGQLGLANQAADLSASFDEHALCLSGDPGTPENPSDQAPKPVHHEAAACCFWHGNTALVLAPGVNLELVGFARSRSIFGRHTRVAARRATGAHGARAPPARA